jgi:hypothetical protein
MSDELVRGVRVAIYGSDLESILEAKAKRVRKPNLAKAIKEAARAGLSVTGATIEAGRVTLQFGQSCDDNVQGNELDDWLSKHRELGDFHARSIKRH